MRDANQEEPTKVRANIQGGGNSLRHCLTSMSHVSLVGVIAAVLRVQQVPYQFVCPSRNGFPARLCGVRKEGLVEFLNGAKSNQSRHQTIFELECLAFQHALVAVSSCDPCLGAAAGISLSFEGSQLHVKSHVVPPC